MPPTQIPDHVTLGFDRSIFEQIDRLRMRHSSPGRNRSPAHLISFHQRPGGVGKVIDAALGQESAITETMVYLQSGLLVLTGQGDRLIHCAYRKEPRRGVECGEFPNSTKDEPEASIESRACLPTASGRWPR